MHDDYPVYGHTEFKQEVRSPEEIATITDSLHEELAKRHLGHKKVPIMQKSTLSDIKDTNLRSLGVSQLVETYYDDLSKESKLYKTEADHMTETTIGFLPDSDGILKTFIDRYTTMLIHDSIYMEEHPAESVLSDTLGGLLDPQIHGTALLGSSKPWDLTMQGPSTSKDTSSPSLEELLSQFHVEHHNPTITMEILGPIHHTSESFTIEAEPKDTTEGASTKKKAKAKQSDDESKADSDDAENESKKIVYPLHGPLQHDIVIHG